MIVTSAERARDLRQPPAVILGAVQGVGRGNTSVQRVYDMAKVGPKDIDAAMIYDAFSPNLYVELESLGLCPAGEVRDFVASGAIGRGGSLPVNTNGGLIGEAYLHGMNLLTEAVRQVRGTAVNQVDSAERVLMTSGRGTCILGRDG
jgi:acetyl-CoA acetyltransferase